VLLYAIIEGLKCILQEKIASLNIQLAHTRKALRQLPGNTHSIGWSLELSKLSGAEFPARNVVGEEDAVFLQRTSARVASSFWLRDGSWQRSLKMASKWRSCGCSFIIAGGRNRRLRAPRDCGKGLLIVTAPDP
jgi:hypothetical protein